LARSSATTVHYTINEGEAHYFFTRTGERLFLA